MWNTELHLLAGTNIGTYDKASAASAGGVQSYMLSKSIASWNNLSYQRVEGGYVAHVPRNYETIANVDYVAFKNSNYGGKWFYGRVKEKQYVNPNSTKLFFDIDAYQTFLGDFVVPSNYVEREHVVGDWNGALPTYNNLVPENIDGGPTRFNTQAYNTFRDTYTYNDMDVIVAILADVNNNLVGGQMTQNIYSGLRFYYSSAGSHEDINTLIRSYDQVGKAGNIVAMFMCPSRIRENFVTTTVFNNVTTENFDGYVPKNAKLYTYPFNYLEVTNQNGESAQYRFELSDNPQRIQFTNRNSVWFSPSVLLFPQNYAGVEENMDAGISLTVGVQCPWASDTFANWLANNTGSLLLRTIGGIAGVAGGLQSGSSTAALAGAGSLGSVVAQAIDKASQPQTLRGSYSGDPGNVQMGRVGFKGGVVTIKGDMVERIDGYFSKYGYATQALKVPNLYTRPFFNYVKLRDAHVNLPASTEYEKQIEEMFNHGVTLWHVDKGATIGNYDVDNKG